MQFPVFVILLCLYSVCGEMYSDRYDNIKLDDMLSNKRLVAGYMKCALDQGPCTSEGKELKFYIKDALTTGCEKCTDRQRQGIKKVMNHLVKNEPVYWKQAVDKYDPDRKYTNKYEHVVQNW